MKALSCIVSSCTRLFGEVIRPKRSLSSGGRQDSRLPNHLYIVHFSFEVQFSILVLVACVLEISFRTLVLVIYFGHLVES